MKKTTKNRLRSMDFDKENDNVEQGKCPLCGIDIVVSEFKDKLSYKEFLISGMCQKCQDDFFDADEDE